jgi:hypothetical protein
MTPNKKYYFLQAYHRLFGGGYLRIRWPDLAAWFTMFIGY